jgi:hypothetical protein
MASVLFYIANAECGVAWYIRGDVLPVNDGLILYKNGAREKIEDILNRLYFSTNKKNIAILLLIIFKRFFFDRKFHNVS